MIKINVITNYNKWFYYIKNPNNYVDHKIIKLNKKNKQFVKNKIFCTLLLSNNKEIKFLNKKFRKKNKGTDVSFPFYTKQELKKKLRKEKEIYLGDIIINLNKIKRGDNLKNFLKLNLTVYGYTGLHICLDWTIKKIKIFKNGSYGKKIFQFY